MIVSSAKPASDDPLPSPERAIAPCKYRPGSDLARSKNICGQRQTSQHAGHRVPPPCTVFYQNGDPIARISYHRKMRLSTNSWDASKGPQALRLQSAGGGMCVAEEQPKVASAIHLRPWNERFQPERLKMPFYSKWMFPSKACLLTFDGRASTLSMPCFFACFPVCYKPCSLSYACHSGA